MTEKHRSAITVFMFSELLIDTNLIDQGFAFKVGILD